nr:alpha-glucan family phosphorylase [uncultured Methanoregula sp.]
MAPDKIRKMFPQVPERISGLVDLAYNLWWSWNPEVKMVFKRLNPQAWIESIHNPVKMLRSLDEETLLAASKNPVYLRHYDLVMSRYQHEMIKNHSWFSENYSGDHDLNIAYFSAEYGLQHSLPLYAGGLGFLAGDHLKESSDLGLPLVAVGFMYSEGYLHQHIGPDGWQLDIKEILDRDAAPIQRVFYNHDEQLVVRIPFIDPPIYVAVWKVDVGTIPLFLMDTDIPENDPANRSISYRLYTGDNEQRLKQEIVLGIGGSYILDVLGVRPSIVHLNEGHPAFTIFERIRESILDKMNFEEAFERVRETTIFTTHTPVPAGHDAFPHALMDKYFKNYYPLLGISRETFLSLGNSPAGSKDHFNMTAFALRMSAFKNGVSKRHGEVARSMWRPLWPDLPEEKIPIQHITNGVHVPTWLDPKMQLLLNKYFSPACPQWLAEHDKTLLWEMIQEIPDEELWSVHVQLKRKLVNRIREHKRRKWVGENTDPLNVLSGGALLDPSALTIGFARRFSTYKRADLIFQDIERLKKIVNNPWKPVQIIFAGKAHPADEEGKRIIQKIYKYALQRDLGGRIAFVEDYGEQMAQYLVHGVDVWLNNPLPPLEACGTSGMKASLNGVLHMSVLDGWWPEAYSGKNGWAFGETDTRKNHDREDAEQLYGVLEREVVPLYYMQSDDGIPHLWVKMMKEAIRCTAPRFSARRMLKEYVRLGYDPALKRAAEYRKQLFPYDPKL